MQNKRLLVLALFVAVCHGMKAKQLVPPTTTPAPPPKPTVSFLLNSTRAAPPTMPPPQQCAATALGSPLNRLRNAMKNIGYTQMNAFYDAFLVFYSDEHLSEEPSPEERRLEYFSGWDGIGTAAVLADGGYAAIWVPTGDVRRANATLATCAWEVHDADDPSVQSIAEWIVQHIGRNARVGADSRLTSYGEWLSLAASFQREGLQLISNTMLLDTLWGNETDPRRMRPDFSKIVANLHCKECIGVNWRDKVSQVRNEIRSVGADSMVVTVLDEVAWLLNIRGRDLPNAPLLKAFLFITTTDIKIYVPPGKLSMPVREALSAYYCQNSNNCTKVTEYSRIYQDLRSNNENRILVPTIGTFQRGASAAIALAVPAPKRILQLSPIIYLKAQKNNAEIQGMRQAHLRDAVAMCTLLSYIEGIAKGGSHWSGLTERSVAVKVDVTRATQAGYVGTAMATRVAFGPSGTEPEYLATNDSNKRIYRNSTLVIHSGGQYDEGTTVVTRTLHFGTPMPYMLNAYTTVLRSLAALATMQVPATLPAAHTDPVARAPLWVAKQDYPHPTGHGVGAALNRREDPVVIDYRQDTNLHPLKEGYFITSEPAWYDRNKFGVRLGNVLEVALKPDGYLGFVEATLLPFEPKLINKTMLTEYEIMWLNHYNSRIRAIVGPELKSQGLMDVYYWMTNKTQPLNLPSRAMQARHTSAATRMPGATIAILLTSVLGAFW